MANSLFKIKTNKQKKAKQFTTQPLHTQPKQVQIPKIDIRGLPQADSISLSNPPSHSLE